VTTHTAQVDDLRLVALSSAVNCTGLFVQFTLTEWSLLPLLDDATRAACHRVSAIVDNSNSKAPGFITVRLRLHGEYLVVEVQDDLAGELPAGSMPEGSNNGVVPLLGRGNLAWFELPLPMGLTAQAVSLPRRDSRRSVITEEMTGERGDPDPAVLQRVLSSLSQWSDR
jgi:hypothetical protein